MTPELKMSGHPTSGTAENSCGMVKRCDSGRIGSTSASRKIILAYWLNRKTWSLVRTWPRSGRPAVTRLAHEQLYLNMVRHKRVAICAHRRPSSSCCRSRSGDTRTIRAKSSCALRATVSTHIGRSMRLRRYPPMLTPARRRSASFSTVLMFGPVRREHPSAPQPRAAHCNNKKRTDSRDDGRLCRRRRSHGSALTPSNTRGRD